MRSTACRSLREISDPITCCAFRTGRGNAISAAAIAKDIFAQRGIEVGQLAPTDARLLPIDETAEAGRAAGVSGAVVMGLGLPMMLEIPFMAGRAEQNNLDGFEVARIGAAPRDNRIHLVNSGDNGQPLGGGELGVPPVAPAVANALFAATGRRIRRLPVRDQFTA